jgi:hypothetical protein
LAAYTESLFLLLSFTALLFAKQKRWFLASLIVGLATLTKVIGLALFVLILAEYFSQRPKINFASLKNFYKSFEPIIYLTLFGLSGFFLYCYYLFSRTGNPFLFSNIQTFWGRTNTISNPLIALSTDLNRYVFYADGITIQTFEVLIIIIALLIIPFVIKRFGLILGIYSLFICTFTLFSGKTESSLRYVLMAFPLFWLLGDWSTKSKQLFYFFIFSSFLLQSFLLRLFLMNYWVG